MCRAVGGFVNSVCRETRELILRCGPARLLSKIGRQNEERLSAETRKSLVLTKDGSQLGELVTIGPQLTRRGTERTRGATGIRGQRIKALAERVDARDTRARERRK